MSHDASHEIADQVGVEPEGIDAGAVLRVTFGTVLIMAVLIVIGYEVGQHAFRVGVKEATQMTGYPQLRSTLESGEALLTQYGVVNAEQARYRIPIDRAIDLMVNEAAMESSPVTTELRLSR